MLSTLHISNIAVIKDCDIEFAPGFNALTGETGAGKSMIIDSISLLMGSRNTKDLIRVGEDKASVSAYFTDISPANKAMCEEAGVLLDEEGGLFVQRDITADGKTKARINTRTVPVSVLRQVIPSLINIHGQHDNQSLLNEQNHLTLLDSYIGDIPEMQEYIAVYNELIQTEKKLASLICDDREKQQLIDMYRFQLSEIDSAKLKVGEEEELENRKIKVKNLEKITKNVNLVYRALYHNSKGGSASTLIEMALKAIDNLADVHEGAKEDIACLERILSELQDVAERVASVKDEEIDNPEAALDIIESRLHLINRLERKYGADIAEVLQHRDKIKSSLDEIELSDVVTKECKSKIASLTEKATQLAQKISDARKLGAATLENEVMSELIYLDMDKVRFCVEISPCKLNARGCDEIRYLISTNKGEAPKPLAKIASGGELARIMLSMKSVFAKKEGTQTLIYDEIDTGISGRTAQKLGFKLRAGGRDAQIICVTHSAQVASACDNHLYIEKKEIDGRANTSVRTLNSREHINEIARIMGGAQITDKLISSAKELIEQAKNR